MGNETPDTRFDQNLRAGLGSLEKPDFESWRIRHEAAVAYLNPVVTELQQGKKRLSMRLATAVTAIAACTIVIWLLIPEKPSFAEAVRRLDSAKTIMWTQTGYEPVIGADGKRTWRSFKRDRFAYRNGIWRVTIYDDTGNPRGVDIVDGTSWKFLSLNLKDKTANDWIRNVFVSNGPRGPFGWVADALERQPLKFVGQRRIKERTVNVFRFHRGTATEGPSMDAWIDPRSKVVVGLCQPGADGVEPSGLPDWNSSPEKKPVLGGQIWDDFDYDAKVDPESFRLDLPPGFRLLPNPFSVNEAVLIEWIGGLARLNNDTFPPSLFDQQPLVQIKWKKSADRTPAERNMYELGKKYGDTADVGLPVSRFINDHTVQNSFRYVGVGVKLNSADSIVCWYRLKSTGKYRAVFGDLTVKDVAPKELPLPVDR